MTPNRHAAPAAPAEGLEPSLVKIADEQFCGRRDLIFVDIFCPC